MPLANCSTAIVALSCGRCPPQKWYPVVSNLERQLELPYDDADDGAPLDPCLHASTCPSELPQDLFARALDRSGTARARMRIPACARERAGVGGVGWGCLNGGRGNSLIVAIL